MMAWNLTLLSLLAFAATGILAALAGVGWRRRREDTRIFTALLVAVGLWALIYGVQLGFTAEPEQRLWQRAVLATSGTVPPLFLLFAYWYAGKQQRLTVWVRGCLAGEAVVFAGLALTNPIHQLVWTRATFRQGVLSPVLDVEFAAGYFVHILFAYAVVALAIWTILSVYFQSSRLYRRQSALMLVGATPAFVAHILFTLKASPVAGLDLTPFVFTFTGVAYGLALFHFDLLDRTPVANQRAIELTGDGLLVVDTDGRIVDSNRIARKIYDFERTGETNVSAVVGETGLRDLHGTSATGVVDGTRRTYELYVSELSAESGRRAGYTVVLRDVTDRDAYGQRLEVANRVLRHNLRNDMNVVSGYAELLAERVSSDEQADLAEEIRATAADLVALSEKARQMVDIGKTSRNGDETTDVVATLAPLVAEFREEHPAVAVTFDYPDELDAVAASPRALTTAVRNLLENAAEHNDTSSLAVEVAVTTDEHQTHVRVSDDGTGLPEVEREVLEDRTETQLRHSSGLGLWLTYWAVFTSGGEISVEASAEAGTAITLTFPNQDSSTTAAQTSTARAEARRTGR